MSLEAETPERPLPQLPAGSDWTAVAEAGIVALPAEDRVRILTTWTTIEGTLLSLPAVIFFFGGLFLMLLVLGDPAELPSDQVPGELTAQEIWGVIAGLAITLYGGYTAFFRLGGVASRVLRLRARAVVRRRRDRLVDPDDRETRFVEVVPRANWFRRMPEDASDVGFLKVDAVRGAVLFEGGIERWAIRGDDIELCAITEIGIPAAIAVRPLVVLEVANAEIGRLERGFAVRQAASVFPSRWRRREAEEIREAIDRLRGRHR